MEPKMNSLFLVIGVFVAFLASESFASSRDDSSPFPRVPHGLLKRVVGGHESEPNYWPWMVEIVDEKKPNTFKHVCGGALIDAEWVLTAAHCLAFFDHNLIVRLGEHDQTTNSETETYHEISGSHLHDRYFADEEYAYDIALLKITPPAHFNKYVKRIDLPRLYEQVPVGTKCVLTGWGKTTTSGGPMALVLRQVELSIVSYKTCAAVNDKFPYSNVSLFSNICTGDVSNEKSGCGGDSGGPLVCREKDGKWFLQGIVSWGDSYCRKTFYSVFTRVSSFIEWIQWKKISPFIPKKTDCTRDYHYYCNEWKDKDFCNYTYIKDLCHKTCVGCA